MGWGDDIMLTAEAKAVHDSIGIPAKVSYWSEIFDGNDHITFDGKGFPLANRVGNRPYHLGAVRTQHGTRVIFNPHYRATPGRICGITPIRHGKILVEPNYKPDYIGVNKDWGWDKYQEFVERVGRDCLQVGPPGCRVLEGVEYVETSSFMDALPLLAGASCFVGPEGGLHHAAAALGRGAVVLFGGHTNPRTTGYEGHINLASEDAGCGSMYPCNHCRQAMENISVLDVLNAVEMLK